MKEIDEKAKEIPNTKIKNDLLKSLSIKSLVRDENEEKESELVENQNLKSIYNDKMLHRQKVLFEAERKNRDKKEIIERRIQQKLEKNLSLDNKIMRKLNYGRLVEQ